MERSPETKLHSAWEKKKGKTAHGKNIISSTQEWWGFLAALSLLFGCEVHFPSTLIYILKIKSIIQHRMIMENEFGGNEYRYCTRPPSSKDSLIFWAHSWNHCRSKTETLQPSWIQLPNKGTGEKGARTGNLTFLNWRISRCAWSTLPQVPKTLNTQEGLGPITSWKLPLQLPRLIFTSFWKCNHS